MNEALFLRNVSALFENYRNIHSMDAKARSVQCKAVLASFWLTMERLSPFFETHFGHYIAGLTERPVTWENPDEPLVGLEIVDGLGEYRKWLRQELAAFEERAGHSAESFYDICEETRRGWGYEQTSKKIRHSSRGSVDLVPSAIRDLHDFLNTVKDYGIWKPGTFRFELRNELRCWAEKYHIEPQIAVGMWHSISEQHMSIAQKADILRRQHGARIEIDVEKFEQELDRISAVMTEFGIEPKRDGRRSSTDNLVSPNLTSMKNGDDDDGVVAAPRKPSSLRSPPDYPARTFDPGENELAALGVADTRELVKLMNERLIAVGKFPITAGDYPTSKAKFLRLSKRWKQMNIDGE